MLYKYQGHLGAYLIVGGYDVLGPHLCMVSAEGKYKFVLIQLLLLAICYDGFGFIAGNDYFRSKVQG
jgi:hypothetical protein